MSELRISAKARAAAGLWYLEQTIPDKLPHVIGEIERGLLSMNSPCKCVLGIAFESYYHAREQLGLSQPEAYLLGFHALYLTYEDRDPSRYGGFETYEEGEATEDWDALQEAWEELLLGVNDAK